METFSKGDRVIVTAGEHEGHSGEVERINAATKTATVRGADGVARSVRFVDLDYPDSLAAALTKGDKVTVTAGEHQGQAGEVEDIDAATKTATVRGADGVARSVLLTDLAAALKKGGKVTVTAGEHKGWTGEIEHIRAATKTATVRCDDGRARSVLLTDLAAA